MVSPGRENAEGELAHPATIRELLDWGKAKIGSNDSEYLLATLLGRRRHELFLPLPKMGTLPIFASKTGGVPDFRGWGCPPFRYNLSGIRRQFRATARRIMDGVPLEYVLRRASFLDFELYVDERVLIPRSETEELVTRAIAELGSATEIHNSSFMIHPSPVSSVSSVVDLPGAWRCLDLGTGSGAIAIALARALPYATVTATDLSAAALDVAAINIQRYGLQDRIGLVHSDLFPKMGTLPIFASKTGGVPDFRRTPDARRYRHNALGAKPPRFDLIISNPPYVPTGIWQRLDASVRDHEPRIALDGGPDGMRCIRRILAQGPRFLKPGGLLALEIDPAVSRQARQECLMLNALCLMRIEQDGQGLDRYLLLSTSSSPEVGTLPVFASKTGGVPDFRRTPDDARR
jgi:release factor glutamine methyltransferase